MWWRTRLASLHRRFKLSDDKELIEGHVEFDDPSFRARVTIPPKPPTGFCREVFDEAVNQWLSRYIPGGLVGREELHKSMSELYGLIDQKISK